MQFFGSNLDIEVDHSGFLLVIKLITDHLRNMSARHSKGARNALIFFSLCSRYFPKLISTQGRREVHEINEFKISPEKVQSVRRKNVQ